ncbi:bacterioferritin [Idiomarina xiamenensis]|uniref:Bacterioferritin n=1 Tax=Idiomarina xiamenensis 10-D-4 TaxID=740709 RepID=K2KBD1_9GAMM|nr:bacterioferritin [Idiomarina xiamenensis]EKE83897.1 bacterioferritin (cytochrome b1) [Idiomarina xiamenensis 10-D-4]
MLGNQQVLQQLNRVLTHKLTAINQYFLHARMYQNWGLQALNDRIYKASIHEMKYADDIIERILLLEGLPNLQELGKLLIGEAPAEMLALDAKLQRSDIDAIREAMAICEEQQDYVSRDMLNHILDGQEEHVDWLDTQLDLIEQMGVETYLQSKL